MFRCSFSYFITTVKKLNAISWRFWTHLLFLFYYYCKKSQMQFWTHCDKKSWSSASWSNTSWLCLTQFIAPQLPKTTYWRGEWQSLWINSWGKPKLKWLMSVTKKNLWYGFWLFIYFSQIILWYFTKSPILEQTLSILNLFVAKCHSLQYNI